MSTVQTIQGHYFDGVSAQAKPASLTLSAQSVHIVWDGTAPTLTVPVSAVQFGQGGQHGMRIIKLGQLGEFHTPQNANSTALFAPYQEQSSNWIDRTIASWRGVAASAVGAIAVVGVLYQWGIPALAQVLAPMAPMALKTHLSDSTLQGLDKFAFKPSELSTETQADIRSRFSTALALAYPNPNQKPPAYTLHFRQLGEIPNAMALPDGTLVVTDGLVNLLKDQPDAITGVLAHELGHVEHHHSMRSLVEFSSLSLIASMILGDYTVWVNQLPLLAGQMTYSRGHETEADDSAIRVMKAAKIDPAVLAVFFERAEKFSKDKELKNGKPRDWTLPDLLSSHPSSAERMAKLRAAGKP